MYRIEFVEDGTLPGDHEFMLVHGLGDFDLAIQESALSASTLEDAWAAYRAAMHTPLPRGRLQLAPRDYGT